MNTLASPETIAAIATPLGKGGVGIVRISGPLSGQIASAMLKKMPSPKEALFSEFKAPDGELIDEGLALFFKAPNSFTGEDVLELQGHGGPVILGRLLKTVLSLGARMAEPGEFSLRAFLNEKMDLVQAEAVADLIDASSERAAKMAMSSLKGAFSEKIHGLVQSLIALRMYVEASIDFPEEEIDFLTEGKVADQVKTLLQSLNQIFDQAQQGAMIKEGLKLVILGKPNAGKSSLLNALAGEERAIVTDIPGTTRDIIREHIVLDGVPFHLLDTAGLRQSTDLVEAEGIRRAMNAAKEADFLLMMMDVQDPQAETNLKQEYQSLFESGTPVIWIKNKIDLLPDLDRSALESSGILGISAKTGEGLASLKKQLLGRLESVSEEGAFIARARHLQALEKARAHLKIGQERIEKDRAGELLAEELREAQNALGQITGIFRPDDLLGVIFSSFCIGK